MNVLITGGTGMVGSLILSECLDNPEIHKVISLVRKPTQLNHAKLEEIVISDFEDYTGHQELFKNIKAAFFCIGVYTGQVSDDLFRKITVDYAIAFAKALKENSPQASFSLLSGAVTG